jgi:hypothetical protein
MLQGVEEKNDIYAASFRNERAHPMGNVVPFL